MPAHAVGIFVATTTGLAEMCAGEVKDALATQGLNAEVRLMDWLDAGAVEPFDTLIVVSSTYGQGDVPDNGQDFYDALHEVKSLTGKRFAVFGLGDRTYGDTFCNGGEKWDALLVEKGATRLAPLERHDASSGTLAEDIAGGWALGWTSLLMQTA